MTSPINHMTVFHYFRDERPWETQKIISPTWSEVKAAIRKMDNYSYPIVQLNKTENDEDEEIFNVCGGDGRWAIFHFMGVWQYEDAQGVEEEVRLWDSDQGYYCQKKNVLTDIAKVLRITQVFFETGSYEFLDSVR